MSRLLAFLREHGVALTAYAPLAQGRAASDPTLARIGAKHGVPASQVAIAWLLDQDHVIAIPKAERRESQQANLDALSLRLDDEDRAAIAELPKDLRYVQPPFAPDWDAVFLGPAAARRNARASGGDRPCGGSTAPHRTVRT